MNLSPSHNQANAGILCREMVRADCAAVAELLTKGFAEWRDNQFWVQAMDRLCARVPPDGLPQFGYVLVASGRIVGVLLLIASQEDAAGASIRRCNVSSWYVEPEFRIYGSLLVTRALRRRDVTYLNVTPAPETWKVLVAQGYRQFIDGRAVAIPLLARSGSRAEIRVAEPGLVQGNDLSENEVTLLLDHARWDCISLVCDTPSGRLPFVFGQRRRRGVKYAYVIYCRTLDSVAEHARPLGRYLARRGIGFMVVDADARLPGMPGWFEAGFPKFYRGEQPPRAGDLAYTERAVFGV